MKIMKVLCAGLTALCLFMLSLGTAFAQAPDMGGLTAEELETWAEELLTKVRTAQPMTPPDSVQTEDGYALHYDFATLYLDTPTLTEKSVLKAVVIMEDEYETQCPRGVNVHADLNTLLSAYANENETLRGSGDFAVLYLNDMMPDGALWAWALRDGQAVTTVQYAIHDRKESGGDSYTDCGLMYSVSEGYITAVRAYGLDTFISEKEVRETLSQVESIEKDTSYFMYPVSEAGTDLEPFSREDLLFSGMDFLSLSPESAMAVLGQFENDEWVQDDTGAWMRIIQWANVEITFAYTKDKTLDYVDTLVIGGKGVEGPRAVQVGDTFASVFNRFRHGENEYDGSGIERLYGQDGEAPFGTAEYQDNAGAVLRYVTTVGEGAAAQTITLHMMFMGGVLNELMIYCW